MNQRTPPDSRPASGTRVRVARVLIVDDEARVANLLRQLLSDEFEVTSTTRPTEALKWLASGNWYDVVLCDVLMPGMTGIELRERVQTARPDLAARFVFMTGGVVRPDVRELLDGLPNLVLEKPIDLASLRELVHRRVHGEPPPVVAQRR